MGKEKKIGLFITSVGILIIFFGIMLFFQPQYTAAAPDDNDMCRVSVSPNDFFFNLQNMNPGDTVRKVLTITNEGKESIVCSVRTNRVDGNPGPGELGDLYPQLLLAVSYKGDVLYSGPMDELDSSLPEAPDLGTLVGEIPAGESVPLDFAVYLSGPGTGNEFQGSTLVTSIVIVITCDGGKEIIIDPEDPGINPEEILPQTQGFNYLGLVLLGVGMTYAGIALILSKKKQVT